MALAFSESGLKRLSELKGRYPAGRPVLLGALYIAQEEFGHVSDEAMEYVAGLLGVAPPSVFGVASFYTMFNRKPVGRHHVQVCKSISCSLLGSDHVADHISKLLGIVPGETTPDGKFTLSLVECLGSCGTAPMMMVNENFYEDLTDEKINRILGELK
jgi:NADH-quinone oxidoreductase subunit E